MKTSYFSSQYGYVSTGPINFSTSFSFKPLSNKKKVELLSKPNFYRGSIQGYNQPVGHVKIRVYTVNSSDIEKLQKTFPSYFNTSLDFPNNLNTFEFLAMSFGKSFTILQETAGFPVFEKVQLESIPSQANHFQLWIPIIEQGFFFILLETVLKFYNYYAFNLAERPDSAWSLHLEKLVTQLKPYAPKGSNSLRFLKAAHFLNIPWIFIEQNTFQFGYGKQSIWLDSSFTDQTSVLATALARNKSSTSLILRKAGLPVPVQYFIRSEEEAIIAANNIGYPVVIKPLNEDGGRGVSAGLYSEYTVKKAFQFAKKNFNQILIEKHILGKDYRLQILQGKLIWAIERIPAGIIGNGINTINELVDEMKQEQPKNSLELSNEVIEFLAEQGKKIDNIPKINEFIPLSRIANISLGGRPVAVNDKVHPDNKRLAETAATILRLDIAGIDLIMPDIQKSYLEQDAAIIEVNAQPHLGVITAPHIYKDILLELLPEHGRIPIVGVIGNSFSSSFIPQIKQLMLNSYGSIGLAQEKKGFINDELIAVTDSLFTAGRSLLLNRTVDALIYKAHNLEELYDNGLPFNAFDYLFIADELIVELSTEKFDWLKTLSKACRGPIITSEKVSTFLIDAKLNHELKLAITLINEPKPSYLSNIHTFCYWDNKHQIIIKSADQVDYNINNPNKSLSKKEQLLLALGLHFSNLSRKK